MLFKMCLPVRLKDQPDWTMPEQHDIMSSWREVHDTPKERASLFHEGPGCRDAVPLEIPLQTGCYAATPAVTEALGRLAARSSDAGLPGRAGTSSSHVTRISTTSLAK